MTVTQRLLLKRLQSSGSESVGDAELLRRFLQQREETAFELLVHRHGAMVLGVCRRVIGDAHEAEDAFQATFLTLARRSGTIHRRQSIGSWLYKVAYRLSLRCRSRVRQHATLDESVIQPHEQPRQHASVETHEQVEALAEEVARLSERLRSVIVLCCLQGKSSSEAARELGCPVNTVSTRLFRAREQLRRSLGRRGFLFSGSIAAALSCNTASALTLAMAQSLASLAMRSLTGTGLSTLVPPAISSLMKGSVLAMWWKPLVVIILASTVGLATLPSWYVNAAEEPLAQNSHPSVSKPVPTNPIFSLITPHQAANEEPSSIVAQFDLDGDGTADLIETMTRGHGPASTHYVSYQLKSGAGYKILRWGTPLDEGDTISAADVMNAVETVHLCTDSGSLLLPMKPEEAKSGPWSGKKGAMGLARLKDNVLSLGFISMSVSNTGHITLHDSHWEPVEGNAVEVSWKQQDDIADVKSQEFKIGQDANKKYMLIKPQGATPEEGYGLVIIMPGGDGGMGFHPFVKRMFKNAIPEGYLVVQPLPNKWSANQQIVWPTEKNKVPGMKHTTEELINSVIDDVGGKHKINPARVFTLTWSSSGPAGYAASLNCPKVNGSFIAMSVFNPRFLPALDNAKGKPYFLYHSPDDRTCPYRMAQQAVTDLGKAGATVELKTYDGGHGWRGPMYDDIRSGVQWLEKNAPGKK